MKYFTKCFKRSDSMASGINIYSQLLISTIRIVDINNLDHTTLRKAIVNLCVYCLVY